jgi:hypothetical protein
MAKPMLVFVGFPAETWESFPNGLVLSKMANSLRNERRTMKYGIDLEQKAKICSKMSTGIAAATKEALRLGLVTQLGMMPLASFEVLADVVYQGCEDNPDWIAEFQMNVFTTEESLVLMTKVLEWLKRDITAGGDSSPPVQKAIKTVEWLRSLYAFALQQELKVCLVLR